MPTSIYTIARLSSNDRNGSFCRTHACINTVTDPRISNQCPSCQQNSIACLNCGLPEVTQNMNDNGVCRRCVVSDSVSNTDTSETYYGSRPTPNPTPAPPTRNLVGCRICDDDLTVDDVCSNCCSQSTWELGTRYEQSESHTLVGSARRFGIEVETQSCNNHRELRGLASWACVNDGSVDGKEFVSVPMAGNSGVNELRILTEFARTNEWKVNSACGLHVHLDAQDLSEEQMFKVAWAYLLTYDLWSSFIPESRKNNYYCAKHFYAPETLDNYTNFERWVREVVNGERYCWINFGAYLAHGTIELRNHTASLNKSKILNWVRAHTRFIDTVSDMSMGEIMDKFSGTTEKQKFAAVSDTWGSDYLTEWYKTRAASFGYDLSAS